ncbi:MAG TPA: ABC transporter permease [Gemmatimonadaceae bacterium]|nr:ABC transporter permease [Gemmatimonadaceae bacterium]
MADRGEPVAIDWRAEIVARLATLRLAPEQEADLVDELAQHAEDRFQELRWRGASVEDARATVVAELDAEDGLARQLVGTVATTTARTDPLGAIAKGSILSRIAQDARYAVRAMRRSPGFSAVVVLTLALGIGAATTIFSVVNGLLIAPLPYRDPEQLVTFWGTAPERQLDEVSFPSGLFVGIRAKSRAFTAMSAFEPAGFTITGGGDAMRVNAATVSLEFFRVFGTPPMLGRTFIGGEDTPDDNRVSVISYGLWQRRFGGDSAIIGKSVNLNGSPSTIVGVMPPEFAMPIGADLWVPLRLDPARFNCWCLSMVGRLEPGLTAADAARDIATSFDDFALQRRDVFPDAKRGNARIIAMPIARQIAGDVRTPLLVLMAAVGLLLLIACSNIANLLLARAAARGREMAVRCCLGASPRRVAAQLLTESAMLAAAGATLGVAFAALAVRLVRQQLTEVDVPRVDQIRLDPLVLTFAVAVTAVCALIFGLAPALHAARVDVQTNLKDGARGSSSASTRRLSDGFVVMQLALSLVLLAGSGLLIRSFRQLLHVNPGFRPENVLVARLQAPWPRYGTDTVVRAFYDRVLAGTAALPGVRAVALTQQAPFTRGNQQNNVVAEGHEPKPGAPIVVSNVRYVTPGYFEAMGTPILQGRGFTASDGPSARQVAIVDETFARRYWPTGTAVGKRVANEGDTSSTRWLTVVGVVPNVRHTSLGETPSLQVYRPHAQRTTWTMYLIVRAAITPNALIAPIRARVAAIDPDVPLYEVRTMEAAVSQSLASRRLTSGLVTAFATVAFVLAAVGVYGVIAISVAGRKREFGVRLALGAQPADVLGLVLRQGGALAGAGIALGLIGAAWVVRFLRGLLFGVSTFDVPTFLGAALLLAAVAMVACLIPARWATRVPPGAVLRE